MKDTSPQVHPTGVEHGFNNGVAGMTLLQYYAGQALGGMSGNLHHAHMPDKQVVVECFNYADMMLAEYNKRYGGSND